MYQLELLEMPSKNRLRVLSSDWQQEAYVSVHLVQEMLNLAGLPRKSAYSHWIPEYKIKFTKTEKKADFLIEDYGRYINFLIEVKSSKTKITDEARVQLEDYLRHSNVRFGLLVDPYSIEAYELHNWEIKEIDRFRIENPREVQPVADFLRALLERIKMRTIAIHTSKGGVGKTTLTVNLAYELAKRGKRVLVIDLDDQANASLSLGVNKADELDKASTLEEFERILDSFNDRKELIDFLDNYQLPGFNANQYIYPTDFNQIIGSSGCLGRIDILPSSHRTKDSSIAAMSGISQKRLDKALRNSGIVGDYDYVIIDTPPNSTVTAMNGLFAAEYVVIPSQLEYLSAHGIRTPIQRLKEVQEETDNKRGRLLGIVPMMTETVNLNSTVKQLIQKRFPDATLLPDIKRTICIGQASHARKPLSLYAQDVKRAAKAAREFSSLTDQITTIIDKFESSIEV